MYEGANIEYVGPVPGGIEVIFKGSYSLGGASCERRGASRERHRIELDYEAMDRLCERFHELDPRKAPK